MLNIEKILLPVDFPNPSLRVVHQAAALAHHFHSEIVMLHVVTARSHAAGVPEDGPELAAWDMLAEMVKGAQNNLDQSLGPELEGLVIRRVLLKGDPARAIVQTWTSLSGRSLKALRSDACCSKATRPGQLCRRLR